MWSGFWATIPIDVEDDAIRAVSGTVEGGGPELSIGKGVAPFGEVEVWGDDGGGALTAFRDEVVEVPVVWWRHGLQAEDIDDEQLGSDTTTRPVK